MAPLTFKFRLKFLTPTFIGGADPEVKTNFSLQPLKAAMRNWWRQTQNVDGDVLWKKESTLFGSTERASSFSLRSLSLNMDRTKYHTAYTGPKQSGRLYLFYPFIRKGGCRGWILPGSTADFAVHFLSAVHASLRETIFALWLAQCFGGLGARNRRGAGSFSLQPLNAPTGFRREIDELFNHCAGDLQEYLSKNGNGPKAEENSYFEKIMTDSPLFINLTSKDRFKRCKSFPSADDLLDHIGSHLRDSRSRLTYKVPPGDDLDTLAMALHLAGKINSYHGPDPIAKSAFGLPIAFTFKQREKKSGRYVVRRNSEGKLCFESWQLILKPEHHDRRASPLHISVCQNTDDEFYANVLILGDSFLPDGEKLELIKKQKKTATTIACLNPPDESALDKFIRSLP